jgi:hypothetical protein
MLIWLPSQVGRETYLGSSSSQRVSKAPIMRQIMGLYGGHVGRKSSQNRMRSLTSVLIYFLIKLAETWGIPLNSNTCSSTQVILNMLSSNFVERVIIPKYRIPYKFRVKEYKGINVFFLFFVFGPLILSNLITFLVFIHFKQFKML